MSITDKLRNIDYKQKKPKINASLKGSILDFKPDSIKEFNDNKVNVLDKDFNERGVKRVAFKPDNSTHLLEDTGTKQFKAATYNSDPFGEFFGFKAKEVPDRKLDGYYEYNMEGKTNNDYLKDNLLREGGNITDLEARTAAKEEFIELYKIKTERLAEIEPDIKAEIDSEFKEDTKKRYREAKMTGRKEALSELSESKLSGKKIEVEKAIRAQKKEEVSQEIKDAINHPNLLGNPENDEALIAKLGNLVYAEGERKGAIWRKALNNIYKKYNLPQITTRMDHKAIEDLNTTNYGTIRAIVVENRKELQRGLFKTLKKNVKINKEERKAEAKIKDEKGLKGAFKKLRRNADEARGYSLARKTQRGSGVGGEIDDKDLLLAGGGGGEKYKIYDNPMSRIPFKEKSPVKGFSKPLVPKSPPKREEDDEEEEINEDLDDPRAKQKRRAQMFKTERRSSAPPRARPKPAATPPTAAAAAAAAETASKPVNIDTLRSISASRGDKVFTKVKDLKDLPTVQSSQELNEASVLADEILKNDKTGKLDPVDFASLKKINKYVDTKLRSSSTYETARMAFIELGLKANIAKNRSEAKARTESFHTPHLTAEEAFKKSAKVVRSPAKQGGGGP